MKKNTTYNLQIYTKCNHKCKMCLAYDFIKEARQISFKEAKKKILRIKHSGYKNIDFAGAEPTMYPDLFKAIRCARSHGLGCIISTNGSLFSSPEYTMKFLEFEPIAFKIPFHSHKKQVFDYITGVKGSYEKVLSGIENINKYLSATEINYPEIKIKKGALTLSSIRPLSKKNSLVIDIPINRFNYKDLPDIVEFLYNRNIRAIKFFQLILAGNLYSNPEMIIGLGSLQPFLLKAVTLAKKFKMIYFLSKLPICILESEAGHFTESHDMIKLTYCKTCRHYKRCCGISKLSLIARYGRQLLSAKDLFPDKFFESFFTQRDIAFIKKL